MMRRTEEAPRRVESPPAFQKPVIEERKGHRERKQGYARKHLKQAFIHSQARAESVQAHAESLLAHANETAAHEATQDRLAYRESARGWLRFPFAAARRRFGEPR